MPQIIVKADRATDRGGSVMLRERVNVADFESDRFGVNLVERLGWAVSDAAEAECDDHGADAADHEHRSDAEPVEVETDAEPAEINGAGSAKHYVPQPA